MAQTAPQQGFDPSAGVSLRPRVESDESELSNLENKEQGALPRHASSNSINSSSSMKRTGWRFVILVSTAGFMFGNFYFFDQTSATQASVIAQTGMSEDTFGALSSVYSFPNVILPLFGGMVIDIFGVRRASFIFTLFVLAGSGLFTFGLSMKSTTILILARVVFGVGGESQNVSSLAFISKWFKGKELSFAVAIDIAVSRLGSVATFDTQGKLADSFGVTTASLVGTAICGLSLLSVIVAVYVDWWCDRKDVARGLQVNNAVDENVSLKDLSKLGTSKLYWLVTLSCVTTYVAAFPFMQVLSAPYLKARFDFGQDQADNIVANVNLTSAFLSPVLGIFVDRFGRRPLLLCFSSSLFLMTIIGFLVWPSCHHCWSVLSLYIVMGIGLSVYGSVIWPCVPLVVDESVVGTAFGLTTALQNLGMALSPIIMTKLKTSENGSFTGPFMYILCCVSVGLASGMAIFAIDARGSKALMRGNAANAAAEAAAAAGEVSVLQDS